ncbi:cysteine protease required for autophagy [Hygrophoropsis aurantiaca]|uniref:Cysteine protease required for autophagy n=1 Tax=Hygrophoropsis aurantiaca TaxID=72124 RepID=A0ACB8A820_9AGAM|nr:cysteine protease required for autophagy [Hygrophoropsis aurantiaca]
MASKQSRNTPSPSSPNPTQHASKLSKFLQKQSRDRSKSMTDPTSSKSSVASSSSSTHDSYPQSSRKMSRFGGGATATDDTHETEPDDSFDEPPVIVEPTDMPRSRIRTERPLSTVSDIHSMYSPSSSARISDLPTRLSGWLSHTFSTSSTDLTLPSILSQSHLAGIPGSPKGKSSALLTAAKHGKGHLDRAMRFILDSDSTPDKCTEPIWLLGVQHPGYEPPPPPTPGRRASVESRRSPSFRSSSTSTTLSPADLSQSQPPSAKNPASNWPPVFYADFTSRIWLTYRSQFAPIRDSNLSALDNELSNSSLTSPRPKKWNWPVGGEKGWTSDAGWGCMLRTGQSLLANALLHLHLGRDWRRPPVPVRTVDYATYVQIITWFLDTPSPQAPFSVHRMALAGKELGKDVGQWFGPSTAAGAIKTLVHAFPDANLGVSVASDGVIFQSDVYAASHRNVHIGSPRRHAKASWGGRAVLVLIGIRLGIDGVNPIYYDTIKGLYTLPQSVGIAGGRPSSSYYFMGSQADNLFYLDPHHARPAVPLRAGPDSSNHTTQTATALSQSQSHSHTQITQTHPYPSQLRSRETTPDNASERRSAHRRSPTSPPSVRAPTSPSSIRTGSSTFSYHAPVSPSPLQHQLSSNSSASVSGSASTSSYPYSHPYRRQQNASASASMGESAGGSEGYGIGYGYGAGDGDGDEAEEGGEGGLDDAAEHYVSAYSAAELKTFHCDRVRKMPLSGLDPSMLLGFLCKDEGDWVDFRRRVTELMQSHKTIFTIQDEPPTWPSDSDEFMGLESISEPDDMDMSMDPDEDEQGLSDRDKKIHADDADADADQDEQFFDTRSASISKGEGDEVEEDDTTEDDPIGPITPGPGSSTFEINKEKSKDKRRSEEFEEINIGKEEERASRGQDEDDDDDDDDWVDPSTPASYLPAQATIPTQPGSHISPPLAQTKSTASTASARSKDKDKEKEQVKAKAKRSGSSRRGKTTATAVPMVKTPSPPAKSAEEHFPFPKSLEESFHGGSGENFEKRMNNARARDGGRTESGGVKAILTDG